MGIVKAKRKGVKAKRKLLQPNIKADKKKTVTKAGAVEAKITAPGVAKKIVKIAVTTSGRPKRALTGADKLPPHPRYLVAPKWGSSDASKGGTAMEVTLGPAACDPTNYGSVPGKDTPSMMKKLKGQLDEYGWIAGHLLNDNMGGRGVAENLTPLTGTANKNHSAIELKIKQEVIKARQALDRLYADVRKGREQRENITVTGVYYNVVRGSNMFEPARAEGLYACDKIICVAGLQTFKLVGQKWVKSGSPTSLSLPRGGVVKNE